MHTHDLSKWQHEHVFDSGNHLAERGAKAVMWITLVMMVVEITGGWWYNSMALLADGWHMSSHALALGLSAFAYVAARRYARDPRGRVDPQQPPDTTRRLVRSDPPRRGRCVRRRPAGVPRGGGTIRWGNPA